MWKVIPKCLPSKFTTKSSYSKDINLVENEFNTFFTSVGPKAAYAASQLSPSGNNYISGSPASTHVSTYKENEQFNFKPVSSSGLHKLIMSMPSNKAPGDPKNFNAGHQRLSYSHPASINEHHQLKSSVQKRPK